MLYAAPASLEPLTVRMRQNRVMKKTHLGQYLAAQNRTISGSSARTRRVTGYVSELHKRLSTAPSDLHSGRVKLTGRVTSLSSVAAGAGERINNEALGEKQQHSSWSLRSAGDPLSHLQSTRVKLTARVTSLSRRWVAHKRTASQGLRESNDIGFGASEAIGNRAERFTLEEGQIDHEDPISKVHGYWRRRAHQEPGVGESNAVGCRASEAIENRAERFTLGAGRVSTRVNGVGRKSDRARGRRRSILSSLSSPWPWRATPATSDLHSLTGLGGQDQNLMSHRVTS